MFRNCCGVLSACGTPVSDFAGAHFPKPQTNRGFDLCSCPLFRVRQVSTIPCSIFSKLAEHSSWVALGLRRPRPGMCDLAKLAPLRRPCPLVRRAFGETHVVAVGNQKHRRALHGFDGRSGKFGFTVRRLISAAWGELSRPSFCGGPPRPNVEPRISEFKGRAKGLRQTT